MKNILVFLLVFISGNALAENTLIAIVNNNPITLNSIKNQLTNVDSVQEKIKIVESQINMNLQIQKCLIYLPNLIFITFLKQKKF